MLDSGALSVVFEYRPGDEIRTKTFLSQIPRTRTGLMFTELVLADVVASFIEGFKESAAFFFFR